MKKRSRHPKTDKRLFQTVQAYRGVYEFSWTSSSATRSLVFGPSTGLSTPFETELPNWNHYKIFKLVYYFTVPRAFEHVNLAIGVSPYQTGPATPLYGEVLSKPGAFVFSLQSRQPSLGLAHIHDWEKNGHHAPRSAVDSTPERMFSTTAAATDNERNQFILFVAPDAVVMSSAVQVHYKIVVGFSSPADSSTLLGRMRSLVLKDLSQLPIKEVIAELDKNKDEEKDDLSLASGYTSQK